MSIHLYDAFLDRGVLNFAQFFRETASLHFYSWDGSEILFPFLPILRKLISYCQQSLTFFTKVSLHAVSWNVPAISSIPKPHKWSFWSPQLSSITPSDSNHPALHQILQQQPKPHYTDINIPLTIIISTLDSLPLNHGREIYILINV